MNYKKEVESLLNVDIYKLEKETITLNNGKAVFSKKDKETKAGEPKYLKPDKYGRSKGAIALLNRNTRPKVRTEDLEYPDPYNWTENLNKKEVFERCHIIAYSLSAKDTDKRNIFIGTNYLNTSIMKVIENTINEYIDNNDNNVLYKVTVKYKDDNQIPTGILIEAKAINDDSLRVCEFCYNIQPNVKINYKNGDIIEDKRTDKEKIINKKQKSNSNKKDKNSETENKEPLQDYILNVQKNEFHIDKECIGLKNVKSEFIQETRARKSDVEKAELKPCEKCCN